MGLQVGAETEPYHGACHCGAVRFTIKTSLARAARCDCSLCRRRGAIMVRCDQQDLHIEAGRDHLSEYRFGSEVAIHYFCKTCGVYPFHRMRKLPGIFAVNAGCLEGVDPFALAPILIEGSKVVG
jgi:hypothetical protein